MKHLFRLTTLFLMLGLLVTCDKDEPKMKSEPEPTLEEDYMTYDSGLGTIGAAGGEISVSNSTSSVFGASITIPKGALSSNKEITISESNNFSVDGKEIIVVKFEPEGLEFSKPVKIGLPFESEDNQNIVAYTFKNDDYIFQELELIEIDNQNNIVYAKTEHFSLFVAASANISSQIGTFIDKRDGNKYKWVKIGKQVWMAQNLAYLPEIHSLEDQPIFDWEILALEPRYYVYDYNGESTEEAKSTDSYKTYGVLYNIDAALTACPEGWHLPTDDEWEQLAQYISDEKGPYNKIIYEYYREDWQVVGRILKSKNWIDIHEINSEDEFGFSALPAGHCNSTSGFDGVEKWTRLWSATRYNEDMNYDFWYRVISTDRFIRRRAIGSYGQSVRCVKD